MSQDEKIKQAEEDLGELLNKPEIRRRIEKWKIYCREGVPFAVDTEDYVKRVNEKVDEIMMEIEREIEMSEDWTNTGANDTEFLLHFVP